MAVTKHIGNKLTTLYEGMVVEEGPKGAVVWTGDEFLTVGRYCTAEVDADPDLINCWYEHQAEEVPLDYYDWVERFERPPTKGDWIHVVEGRHEGRQGYVAHVSKDRQTGLQVLYCTGRRGGRFEVLATKVVRVIRQNSKWLRT